MKTAAINLSNLNRFLILSLAFAIPMSVTATGILSALLLVSATLNLYRQKFSFVGSRALILSIFLICVLYLLAAFYSVGTVENISLAIRKATRLLFIPLLAPLFVDAKLRSRVIWIFLVTTLFSIIVAIYSSWPVFKDTIFTSMFAVYTIFILAHYFVEYKAHRWWLGSLCFALCFYLFHLNTGRTGQLIFFALYALFCWQQFGRRWLQQVMAAIVLAVFMGSIILLPSSFMRRNIEATQEALDYVHKSEDIIHTSSTGVRLMLARNSLPIIQQKPVFGWGTGSYTEAYRITDPEEQVDKLEPRANPHNQYLLILVELGIVGFLVYAYFFFNLSRQFLTVNTIEAKLGVGLIVLMLVGCLANSWLLDFTSAYFFVFFAAMWLGAVGPRVKLYPRQLFSRIPPHGDPTGSHAM